MFNLLVSADEEAWSGKPYILDLGRYLEHTPEPLRADHAELTQDVIAAVTGAPALFAYETGVGKPARLGRITEVLVRERNVRIAYDLDPEISLTEDDLTNLKWELELGEHELQRTHWALKRGDLISILENANLIPRKPEHPDGGQGEVTRAAVLEATERLQRLGHTAFDRMLLEFGVDGLDAGRSKGGLLDRANALAEFAIHKPAVQTAEGQAIRRAIVDYADRKVPAAEPNAFEQALHPRPWAQAAERKKEAPPMTAEPEPRTKGPPAVFVVHGRDAGAKHEVARFLERLGLEAVILHEKPNLGRTLINKFQEVADGIQFAVVLMTPDDEGGLRGERAEPRARQNVVFELGFFIGKLGASRVCALVTPGVERPSDFEAIVYIAYGEHTTWKNELARELFHAGLPIDTHKLL
jgi:predicted nucleotide-binding protein